METQVTTKSARETEVQNRTYCGDVSLVGWMQVSIEPHNRKNPESSEDGVWVVVGFRNDLRKYTTLAEGTKEYCENYVRESKVAYAYDKDNRKKLWNNIYDLLIEAGTIALALNHPNKLSWAEQQNLIDTVHKNTREARAIASLYNGSSMYNEVAKVKRDCEVARRQAFMTVLGRRVWNVYVCITEKEAEKIDWATVSLAGIKEEQKSKLPNHFTYQLVSSHPHSGVIVQGTKGGCEAFLYACQIHFQEIARIAAQQKEEEEKVVGELKAVLQRLNAGEKFVGGELQKKTQIALQTANQFGFDVTNLAEQIMNVALSFRASVSRVVGSP